LQLIGIALTVQEAGVFPREITYLFFLDSKRSVYLISNLLWDGRVEKPQDFSRFFYFFLDICTNVQYIAFDNSQMISGSHGMVRAFYYEPWTMNRFKMGGQNESGETGKIWDS